MEMAKMEFSQKLTKLHQELKVLESRLTQTLVKSHDLFAQGGDGGHDNQSYELIMENVRKLQSMIDEVCQEITELKRQRS